MQTINLPASFYEMGNHRKFKYVLSVTGSHEATVNYFIQELHYKKYEVSRIIYHIRNRKEMYQKKINRLVNPHITN